MRRLKQALYTSKNKVVGTLYCSICTQGFFRDFQKLNLELSFETQSSHQTILCSKMKSVFELRLNSWRVQISFQLKTRKLSKKWLEFISQHKKNNAFAIFNQFIVSLSAPALTHCISTTLKWAQVSASRSGGGGGGEIAAPDPPAVQLNSTFSAKTDPRENPGKKPWHTGEFYNLWIIVVVF
jgi:hypothetical protein